MRTVTEKDETENELADGRCAAFLGRIVDLDAVPQELFGKSLRRCGRGPSDGYELIEADNGRTYCKPHYQIYQRRIERGSDLTKACQVMALMPVFKCSACGHLEVVEEERFHENLMDLLVSDCPACGTGPNGNWLLAGVKERPTGNPIHATYF